MSLSFVTSYLGMRNMLDPFFGYLHPADGKDYHDFLAGYVLKGSDSKGFRRFRSYDSTLAAKSGIV